MFLKYIQEEGKGALLKKLLESITYYQSNSVMKSIGPFFYYIFF